MSNERSNVTPLPEPVREVPIFDDLEAGAKRCRVCEFRCVLMPGQTGACNMRTNQNGKLLAFNYGVVSRADMEIIETHGFFHFFPGARVFSLGSFGWNLPDPTGQTKYNDLPTGPTYRSLPLDRLARFTIERQCRGVLFTFNEPTMNFEYLVDAAKTIKANGMYTAMITNGYATNEAVEMFGHYMDGVRVEVNSLSLRSFQKLTGQSQFPKVLECAVRAKKRFNAHLEISTTFYQGINDSPDEIQRIAGWIKLALGPNTPWHITADGAGNDSLLLKAKILGEELGLHYIYPVNLAAPRVLPDGEFDSTAQGNTYCFNCKNLLIQRGGEMGSETRISGLNGSKCDKCGTELEIHNTIWKLK